MRGVIKAILVALAVLALSLAPVRADEQAEMKPEAPAIEPPAPAQANTPYFTGGDSGISTPKRIHYRAPTYPAAVKNRRLESKITLQLTINVAGKVENVEVLACSVKRSYEGPTHEFDQFCDAFERAAKNAAGEWRYEPSLLDGKPVPVYYTVRVDFSL